MAFRRQGECVYCVTFYSDDDRIKGTLMHTATVARAAELITEEFGGDKYELTLDLRRQFYRKDDVSVSTEKYRVDKLRLV